MDLYPERDGDKSIDLPQIVSYLTDWSMILTKDEGFKEIALRASEKVDKKEKSEPEPKEVKTCGECPQFKEYKKLRVWDGKCESFDIQRMKHSKACADLKAQSSPTEVSGIE